VVWRDHTIVQVGVDPVIAIIEITDEQSARALAELTRGTNDKVIERLLGGAAKTKGLIEALGTSLIPPIERKTPNWLVVGSEENSRVIIETISRASRVTFTNFSELSDSNPPDLVVLISNFVISPSDVQPWLSSDIAHIPIVFGESSVSVGPRVEPGLTPCLRCCEMERLDSDPAWAAISPQLWRKTLPVIDSGLAVHAAGELLRLSSEGGGHSVRIDAQNLQRLSIPHSFHPGCGCLKLPAAPEG
jgi:hypothetical protein